MEDEEEISNLEEEIEEEQEEKDLEEISEEVLGDFDEDFSTEEFSRFVQARAPILNKIAQVTQNDELEEKVAESTISNNEEKEEFNYISKNADEEEKKYMTSSSRLEIIPERFDQNKKEQGFREVGMINQNSQNYFTAKKTDLSKLGTEEFKPGVERKKMDYEFK